MSDRSNGSTDSLFEDQTELPEDTFSSLIEELSKNRKDLHKIVKDVEALREKLNDIIPSKLDYRSRHLLENKLKTIATVISSELQVRKQIDDNIKLEVELRTKTGEGEVSQEQRQRDIRMLAEALEHLKKKENKTSVAKVHSEALEHLKKKENETSVARVHSFVKTDSNK